MAAKPVEAFLAKLTRVRRSGSGWEGSCPVSENHRHGDRKRSLTVAEGEGGRVLVTCQKGTCDYEAICAAMGIDVVDLFPADADPKRVVLESYPYVDDDGKILFVVDRTYPKGFHQRRPAGGGWAYDLKGVKSRPLYRLPQVLEAVAAGKWILVAEGERDVHALEAQGLVATTNPGGSGKWRAEHSQTLAGAKVRVIADADEVGRKHAAQVVASLQGVAATVEAFEPTKGKDVREHLAAGGELSELAPMGTRPVLEVLPGGKPDDDFELVLGVRDGDAVVAEAQVPEMGQVTYEASWIRRDRFGVHAETRISVGGKPLKQSMINLSKHEDRTKLANAAAECFGDKAHGAPLRLRLDHFAMNVWEWWTQASGPALVTGGGFAPPRFLLEPYVIEGGITMLYGPPKSGKALAVDTPIPTPRGWTTMGGLSVGDEVFGADGCRTRVVAATEVQFDRPCYGVRLDTGEVVVADENHTWRTSLDRRSPDSLVSTARLARPRKKRALIRLALPIELPEATLPIPPYTLGLWLGDGTASQAAITSGLADIEELRSYVEADGFRTRKRSAPDAWGVLGLHVLLREQGLFSNKHVPRRYLRASVAQREALLQGLVDSDGYVAPSGSGRGRVEFSTTNEALADAVEELVASLGSKASVAKERAKLNGIDHGPRWRVFFYHPRAARLERKRTRLRIPKRMNHYVNAVETTPVPVRCIQVEAADGMFLAGRSMIPTHNSYVGLLMALTLTHGITEWAHTESTAPVAFVNLERPPDTVGYRLQRVAHAIGCPASLVIQHEKGRKFADVAPSTIRWLDSNPGGVIVLDSLSRMGAGDLNSNEDTNRAMDLLHSLKASVVVLAHTPRADASHVFGSVMHDAAADVLVRCEKAKGLEPNLMGVRITVDDGNDVGWAPPKTWALEFERGVGLSAIRPAKPDDFPELADVRPIRERARDYLELVTDATTRDIADELGIPPDSLSRALRREPETFSSAAPKGGRGKETWWTLTPTAATEVER